MAVLASWVPLSAAVPEDAATEGKKIITAMLIVGLVFIGVIALGQTSRWFTHRRHARRANRTSPY
jgi:hypothetical protein